MGSCGGRPFPGKTGLGKLGGLGCKTNGINWRNWVVEMLFINVYHSGKHTKNYRKIHHFQWENLLKMNGHFQ
jgi:hypothetical protein